MLTVDNLSIETKKGRKLIDGLTFSLNDGDKLAIIGEEGNGKSTLLKAIYDDSLISNYCTVKGCISKDSLNIGYLEQKLNANWDNFTVTEYFLKDSPSADYDYDRYNEFYRFERALKNLDFDTCVLANGTLIKNLSGGEKVKIQLAKILTLNSDLILLDEPTNDLDIYMLEKLESFILNTNTPIIYISHDETLLENTANKILHIEQLIRKTKPQFTLKKCNYVEYVSSRQRQIEHQTQIAYSERREKEKKEEILRNIKQKVENALIAAKKDPASGRIIAKKMANIKAQEKKLDEEELTEIPDVEEAIKVIVNSSNSLPNQKKVIELNLPQLKIGNKLLSRNIKLSIFGPQRVAIVGKNGCGKTTLIRNLIPELENTPGLKIGYFSQNYAEMLDYKKSPLEEIQETNNKYNAGTLIGCLKFTREEMLQPIATLSEGQKAKLLLLKLTIGENNVLVLDEPTRNLSPLSGPVIRKMLKSYKGAIITVSHDRKFINEICDKVYELTEEGLYPSNMTELDKG